MTGGNESAMEAPRIKTRLQDWVQAFRVPFLVAAIIPPLLGFVLASKDTGVWKIWQFALILAACVCLQIATNLLNDYFDHFQGADDNSVGGSRAIQEGKIDPRQYIGAVLLCFGIAVVIGMFGAWYTGHYGIIVLIVFALFTAVFYVGPPIRYGYRGFGELMVFLSMGIGACAGTYYTLTGAWAFRSFSLAVPIGLMIAGIMNYQSLPEIDTDGAVGKWTLAAQLGRKRAFCLFYAWWPIIWALMLLPWIMGLYSWFVVVGILLSLPMYFKLVGYVRNVPADGLFSLDAHGHYVRKMYVVCGLSMIIAVAMM